MRQQTQRDVTMPGVPSPDFVVVETYLSLGLSKAIFNLPAPLADLHQLVGWRLLGAIGLVEGQVLWVFGATAGEQPASHPLYRVYGKLQASPLPRTPLTRV